MCGIASIFAWRSTAPDIDREELERINAHMFSRGPDDGGTWISPDGRVGLAARRLAIIDLTAAGHQPMCSTDGRYVIVFNGEIYNHAELRARLETQGIRFRSTSDTEVVLHLYAQEGAAMLGDLRGMFGLSIWDSRERTLFLARDAYGIKPLYYVNDGSTIRVASQVKALMAGGAISTTIDPAGAAGFFLFGHVPEPFTIRESIRAVPAGCHLTIDENGPGQPVRWFSVAETWRGEGSGARGQGSYEGTRGQGSGVRDEGGRGMGASAREILREALLDSIRAHLVSDVPVGLFLSSGIDSATILALAHEMGTRLRTVTLEFDEYHGSEDDEGPVAESLAHRYGADHTRRLVTRAEFEDDLPKILEAMDQPTIDGVNTWFVSKAAKEIGLKVALSGLGGDELFGGYPSFRDIPRMVHTLTIPSRIPFAGVVARQLLRMLPTGGSLSPKAAGLLEYGGSWAGAYLLRRGLYMPWELPHLLGEELAREGLRRLDVLNHIGGHLSPAPGSDFARVSTLESSLYMRNQLLRDTDWASMAHSVEVRVPLVDTTLIRKVVAVSPSIVRSGKKAVLASLPALPLGDAVAKKSKTGFSVPFDAWVREGTKGHAARGWSRLLWQKTSTKRKRILMLTTDAFGGFGGISVYNEDFITAVASHPSCDSITVLPRTPGRDVRDVPDGVRWIPSAGGKVRYLFTFLREVVRSRNVDLVICGHINLLPLASLAAFVLRSPSALLIYGIDAWAPHRKPLTRWLARRVDNVISISKVTSERFASWAGDHPTRLLSNAVHLERYGIQPKNSALLRRHHLEGRTIVMTLGRMTAEDRYKGFDSVIAVMPRLIEQIPNLVYLACGDGADAYHLRKRAEDLGIGDRVVFPGRIPDEEKADYYRLADAFVMLSVGEGFGFVVLEALACGVPVVASSRDGTREALRDGMLGTIVDPEDSAAIERAVIEAIGRSKEISEGLAHFAWPQFVKRCHAVLDELLGTAERMRILFLATDAYGALGGIGAYNADFLDALCSSPATSEVVLITRHPPRREVPVPAKLRWRREGSGSKISFVTTAMNCVVSGPPFDLVICGHTHLLPVARLAAFRNKEKPVVVIHGIDAWTRPNWLVARLIKGIRAFISVSEVTMQRFNAWAQVGAPGILLPNVAHLERFTPGERNDELVARYGLEQRSPVLMTFGRLVSLERAKGFDEVIDLLPSLRIRYPSIAYLVCGDGPDRNRLQEKVKSLGLEKSVIFCGMVDEREKVDHYRLADVFVMPSRGEGFGIVFLEAMACGVPVVASKLDGGREAVRNGLMGALVDPSSPAEIEQAIVAALAQPRQVPFDLEFFSYPRFEERCHAMLEAFRKESKKG